MIDDQVDPQSEEDIVLRVREEAAQVPPLVSERLREIRREAVASDVPDRSSWRYWPVAGIGVAAMLVLTVMINLRAPEDLPELPVIDAQELAVFENLELLESLEFLAWLEEAGANAG